MRCWLAWLIRTEELHGVRTRRRGSSYTRSVSYWLRGSATLDEVFLEQIYVNLSVLSVHGLDFTINKVRCQLDALTGDTTSRTLTGRKLDAAKGRSGM